jgi:threonine dehydratase
MLTLGDVHAAQRVIQPHIWRTPLLASKALSQRTGGDIWMKAECWQQTGSFKVRGALNKLASLESATQPASDWPELVTASAGNHGLGVAYASQALGLPQATIFVPETASETKLNRLNAFRCNIHRAGTDYDTCHALAEAYAQERNARYISAYDDPVIIAGQATTGLEILEDLPDADLLLVPVGGGGLIAGIAIVARAINPGIRVVGIQPEASPAAYLSLRNGQPHETYPAGPTICDGLAGGFGRVPFDMAADLIDSVLIVPEVAIRHAVAWLVAHEQMVVEGSGAIAVAPLLSGQLSVAGKKVVAVLTGRNLDAILLSEIMSEHPNGPLAPC